MRIVTHSLTFMNIPSYSASAVDDRTIFIILHRTKIGPFEGGSWCFGVLAGCDETSDAATGILYGRKVGVGVNPEAHVTGDVPDGGIGECGNEIKEFFCCGQGFFGRLCLVGSDLCECR